LRRRRKALRSEEREVPICQRVVMVMKMRKSWRLGSKVDTTGIYLQVFKNIPRQDLNMLLPGARARMSLLDRARIVLPIVTGMVVAGYQIAYNVANEVAKFVST